MRLLILGGSGFLSGTLSRLALSQGHQVWTVTRGRRAVPDGARAIVADRKDRDGFARAVGEVGVDWDLAVDCIGFEPADAEQDLAVFGGTARQLVFISTDFVYDPARRRFPQTEDTDHYLAPDDGYGGKKRACERVLLDANSSGLAVTVLRPCHIYGPGSQLGCLPRHGRDPELIRRLRDGESLALVGGGHFLQQPILVDDLAAMVLSVAGQESARGQVFCAAGPDIVESRHYYEIIADVLGVAWRVEEVPVAAHQAAHPEAAPFLCHRIYDLSKARGAGLAVPATPLAEGLRKHVESLL
jgi:nucleoside-diphosphate-sugar epimerase